MRYAIPITMTGRVAVYEHNMTIKLETEKRKQKTHNPKYKGKFGWTLSVS